MVAVYSAADNLVVSNLQGTVMAFDSPAVHNPAVHTPAVHNPAVHNPAVHNSAETAMDLYNAEVYTPAQNGGRVG